MQFWVYENYPTNHVTVHEASCGFCNDGRGKNMPGKSSRNGQWHGPYLEFEAAVVQANLLKRPANVHLCCRGQVSRTAIKNESWNGSEKSKIYHRFEVEPTDEETLTLEELFHRRLLQLYVVLRDEGGYSAVRFLNSVRRNGGVKHSKKSLRRQVELQSGFEVLKRLDMLDMSMESHVVDPKFEPLFTPSEIYEANRRLKNARHKQS